MAHLQLIAWGGIKPKRVLKHGVCSDMLLSFGLICLRTDRKPQERVLRSYVLCLGLSAEVEHLDRVQYKSIAREAHILYGLQC